MNSEKIIIIGGGGHCRVVLDAIKRSKKFSIYGVLDPKLPKGTFISGVKVIGTDDALPKLAEKGIRNAFIGVGSIGNCKPRKRLYNNLKNLGFALPVIIHPGAVVADDVLLSEGAFVAAGTVINPGVKIGKNAIINTSSSVDHDCRIGDFVHIAPGVTLSGGVKIGDETHVGTGANVIQYIAIGKKVMIGAGQTIRSNVGDGVWRVDKRDGYAKE